MPEIVPVVLASWVILSVVLFWRLPGRDAALIVLIGGWAFLPVGSFPVSVFGEPVGSGGSMHALAVPTALLVNKATAIALGCLAGSMIFDWPALKRVRPSRLDLPIVIWCLTPIASALANGLGLADGLAQVRYLALSWGVPYLMGRAYLVDNESLRRLGLGLVLAGLAYVPVCLVEIVAGPFLYTLVYGPCPYQLEGATRYVLHRPMLFSEHGNQLGMWVASAAVCATWLWRSGTMNSVMGVRGGVVAAVLVTLCLVCQSMGAVLLTLCVLVLLFLLRRPSVRSNPIRGGAGAAVLVLVLMLAPAAAEAGGGVREQARNLVAGASKQSLNWRLARSWEHLPQVAPRPLLGWGRADWSAASDHTFVNPVNLGLWLLTLGMYGVVGLVSSTLVLTLPVVEVVRWLPRRAWLNPGCSAVTLVAILLCINVLDSLFNSVFLLPLLAGAGGLHSWSMSRYHAT